MAQDLDLTDDDRAMLDGRRGGGTRMAMEILVAFARAVGAPRLIGISGAHIDGCLYHGRSTLDFVERLLEFGARVAVPTTLNVGAMDLIHPEIMTMPTAEKVEPTRLMKAHEELGCVPTFTCAPYQTLFRPRLGDQIAWGESNAIAFANSVIGARTNRYGDFVDLCCAITGRAPEWGLHLTGNRRARLLFRLTGFPDGLEATDSLYVAVGLLVGRASGELVPAIDGLPKPRDEDQLKALGAAAASSGAVGLFHVVGVTPEAPDLATAFQNHAPDRAIDITPADVAHALGHLSTVPDGTALTAVCLGTPHFSRREWDRLLALLPSASPKVPLYVNTARDTLAGLEADGRLAEIERHGIITVSDTCTYLTAIIERLDGIVMTNSGKMAHYAPGNLGVEIAFGELEDCVASAAAGRVMRLSA